MFVSTSKAPLPAAPLGIPHGMPRVPDWEKMTLRKWLVVTEDMFSKTGIHFHLTDHFAIPETLMNENLLPVPNIGSMTNQFVVDKFLRKYAGVNVHSEEDLSAYDDPQRNGVPSLVLMTCSIEPDDNTTGHWQKLIRANRKPEDQYIGFQDYCIAFAMFFEATYQPLDITSRTLTPEKTLTREPVLSVRWGSSVGGLRIFGLDSRNVDKNDGFRKVIPVPLKYK